jgi:hypothetical protein
MALKFKTGAKVRQVVPVIVGSVTGMSIAGDEVVYSVEYTDADGVPHERFFGESEIEAAE